MFNPVVKEKKKRGAKSKPAKIEFYSGVCWIKFFFLNEVPSRTILTRSAAKETNRSCNRSGQTVLESGLFQRGER